MRGINTAEYIDQVVGEIRRLELDKSAQRITRETYDLLPEAIIATTFSITANETSWNKVLQRYRFFVERKEIRPRTGGDLLGIRDELIDKNVFENESKIKGKHKKEIVFEIAEILKKYTADIIRNYSDKDLLSIQCELESLYGVGPALVSFLFMKCGVDRVKGDRMICRFVKSCGIESCNGTQAAELVQMASDKIGVPATQLDLAIWSYQRNIR